MQSLNDQLNTKLQYLDELQGNFDRVQQEYSNSLVMLNEQNEMINGLENQNHEMNDQMRDMQLTVDHSESTAKHLESEMNAKIQDKERQWDGKVT